MLTSRLSRQLPGTWVYPGTLGWGSDSHLLGDRDQMPSKILLSTNRTNHPWQYQQFLQMARLTPSYYGRSFILSSRAMARSNTQGYLCYAPVFGKGAEGSGRWGQRPSKLQVSPRHRFPGSCLIFHWGTSTRLCYRKGRPEIALEILRCCSPLSWSLAAVMLSFRPPSAISTVFLFIGLALFLIGKDLEPDELDCARSTSSWCLVPFFVPQFLPLSQH